MHRETMTLGKKTLRLSVRWIRQIMAEAKEEIAVVITHEVIIMGVIEAQITTMEATTTTKGEEVDGVEVVTIRKGKELDIIMERVEVATIKTVATKNREVATAMEVAEVAILREVTEADTTAWEEVEGQEVAVIKMAINQRQETTNLGTIIPTVATEEDVEEEAAVKRVKNWKEVIKNLGTITKIVISTIEVAKTKGTTKATSSDMMVKKATLTAATEEGVVIAGVEAKIIMGMADLRRKAPSTNTLLTTNGIILAKNSSSGSNRPAKLKKSKRSEFGYYIFKY